ncbi:MAG: DUF4013 domain-containing protein [Anaerolineales bacterium]|nr:DUF4013 domain-containing protein [Anaerolineales bacterium]
MNIGKAFSFPFDDKQWISKLGLGALITMVPILNFAWTGYMVQLLRNVMNNQQEPLPTWENIDKKFMDGLILGLAGLVYSLPILIVICLPLSIMVIPALMAGNGDMQDIANTIAGAGSVLLVCLSCMFALYGLALSVIYPGIMIVFSREGTFASCFKLREVFNLIGRNTGSFFTAWGVSLAAGFGVGLVAGFAQVILNIIPCIGQLASFILTVGIVAYTSAIYAHLFGQFGMSVNHQGQIPMPS